MLKYKVNTSQGFIEWDFFLHKKRSAPFLLKTLWGTSFITTITSPASTSGTSSPSPCMVYYSPFGAPLSTSILSFFFSATIFFPLHVLHFLVSSIVSPLPLHSSQGPLLYEYIPGPNYIITVLIPFPLQPLHF